MGSIERGKFVTTLAVSATRHRVLSVYSRVYFLHYYLNSAPDRGQGYANLFWMNEGGTLSEICEKILLM
jgi:hypothetical protein